MWQIIPSLKTDGFFCHIFIKMLDVNHYIVDLPLQYIIILSKNNHLKVRNEVASSEKTPIYILRYLAKDNKEKVRCSIVKNLNR